MPLLQQVVNDLEQQGLLRRDRNITSAFRLFLVPKGNGSARPILDLSPWTLWYRKPPITLYSAAQVLSTIPPHAEMFKLDLKSGFYYFCISSDTQHNYGIYYNDIRYAWTRLPMGHPLAPSVMQRISTAVTRHLYKKSAITMVAYLDDWLFFSEQDELPVPAIIQEIQYLGFCRNFDKSILYPVTNIVYLGLQINCDTGTTKPTPACLAHLRQLLTLVPHASRQDLVRRAGYVSWLTWAMAWPQFLAQFITQCNVTWITMLMLAGVLNTECRFHPPLVSRQLYTDVTQTSTAALSVGPPWQELVQHYADQKPIAWAEWRPPLED